MRYWRRPGALFAALAVLIMHYPGVVSAQKGASGLQISPTRHELTVEPGEVKQISFIVKNITNTDVTARVRLNDFKSDDTTGQPQIIVDESQRSDYSLRGFIQKLEDVELKVGESKEVKVTLDIPADAAPSAYFGVIRFDAIPKSTQAGGAQREISLTASVAPLVLVQVNGEIKEQIEVQKVTAARSDKAGSFFFSAPNKVAITIKNLGNGFSKPFGRVTVQNILGKEVTAYELNNTDPRGNILPKSVRTFRDDLKSVKLPGRYSIVASVAHGSGGEVVNYRASFWYLPAWALLALLVIVAGLGVLLYFLYRRRGYHNKRR